MGAKPRENFLSIPVGSHSTYISVLYRVGIMGLLAFIAFQISCIFAWLRIRINLIGRDQHRLWSILGVALIAMSIWMIGEDIDAPQLVAFLYFILVGIIFAFGKYARNQAKDLS
jgi:O-antigen ligase